MKKKSAKKCISFFMVLLLCASFLPMCVFAAETGKDTEQTGYSIETSVYPNAREIYGFFVTNGGMSTLSDLWINLKYDTYALQEYVASDYKTLPLTWSSSDASIAEIDGNGQAKLHGPGCITIRAERSDHDYGSFRLHIYQIVVDKPSVEMNIGDTTSGLAHLIVDRNDSVLTYRLSESSDENVVEIVDESGTLRAVGEGSADIIIGVRFGLQDTKLTETVKVIVSDPEAAPPAGGDSEGEIDDQSGGGSEGGTGDQPGDSTDAGTDDQSGSGSDTGTEDQPGDSTDAGTDDQSGGDSDAGTEEQSGDESESGTVVPGSDSSGGGASGTGSDGQNTIIGGQTDTGVDSVTKSTASEKPDKKSEMATAATGANPDNTETASKATVTKKTVTKKTVTRKISSPGGETASGVSSRSTRPVAIQNSTEVTPEGETAAVPADVINEPSVPTAAYVNPAGGGGGILPSADTMAAHAGAVAGMLAAVAAFGAAGMVKAYKVKKYEADV